MLIQWEVLGWHFDVTVHAHLAGGLGERMRAVTGSALGLWVEEDVGVPLSCRLVTFMVSTVSAQEVLVALPSFSHLSEMPNRSLRAPLIAMMQSENVNPVITTPLAQGVGLGRVFKNRLPPPVADEMTLDEIRGGVVSS